MDLTKKDYYHTPLSDSVLVKYGNGTRRVCPECINHSQGEPGEVHDCKNLFVLEDGSVKSQCCCYSKEHGIRDRKNGW